MFRGEVRQSGRKVCNWIEHPSGPSVLCGKPFHFMKTMNPLILRRLALSILAGFALAAAAGCTHVQVSPQTRGEYKLGELQVFVDRDFEAAYAAAKNGMKDAGLFAVGDDKVVVEAELNGRDSTDTRVVVKIKEVAKNRTSIKIRYGLKGDLASAQRLYAAIEKRL